MKGSHTHSANQRLVSFVLALQFHPERDALGDSRKDVDGNPIDINQDQCNALLGALVKYAGVYQSRQVSIFSKLF